MNFKPNAKGIRGKRKTKVTRLRWVTYKRLKNSPRLYTNESSFFFFF